MIREIVTMEIQPDNDEQAKDTIRFVAEYMHADSGCLKSSFNIETEQNINLRITSEWSNDISHQRYISSEAFLGLMLLLDLAVPEPQIRYEVIEEVHGLEYISKHRLNGSSPM